MAYGFIGNSPIDRASISNSGHTYLDLNFPALCRGIIKSFSVYAPNATTGFRVKVFRDDGTNYLFIGESPVYTLAAGLNSDLRCWIPVEKGDYFGMYHVTNSIDQADTGGVAKYYLSTNVVFNTLKSAWGNTTIIMSFQGKIFSRVAPL